MSWCILNGEVTDKEQARLRWDDRGLLLGDGLFETMRAYQGRVMRPGDHFRRLLDGCREFQLSLHWSEAEFEQTIDRLLEKNQLEDARVRVTLTRGRHLGSMSLAGGPEPTSIVTAEPIPAALAGGAPNLRLATVFLRVSEHNPIFRHKTLNRLPHLHARAEAERKGADEALILDERGNVASTSTGNLFAVHQGALFTAPLNGQVLPGVTRKVALELAREMATPVREEQAT